MLDQKSTKTSLDAKVTTRAVLYARVSSDDTKNEGRNLQGQLEMCREYAQSKGYHIVAELAEDDRGASGATIDLPQLNRIRDMAQKGEFDVLVVREIDRLSRNLAKQLIVEDEVNRAGVKIEYVLADYEDTPEGRLSKHIRATVAEYEREKIRERTVRARRNKAKSGSVMVHGRPPYGYRVIEQSGKWALEIDPEEARIVRLIFEWYTVGDSEDGPISIRAITRKLTEMGVPTAADKGHEIGRKKKRGYGQWHRTTIHYILKSKTYYGTWLYGKRKSNGKYNPSDSLIDVQVPAIIDRKTWKLAQDRLEQNKQDSKRNRKRNYLLAGHISCGACLAKMAGVTKRDGKHTYQYYFCLGTKKGLVAHKCAMPYFRLNKVDDAVWKWLVKITSDPKYLRAKLKEYQEHQDQVNEPIRRELATIDDLLGQNHSRRKRWLEMYEAGVIELDELKEKQAGYERTITGLESRQAELKAKLQDDLTDEIIEDILEFASILREEMEFVSQDFAKKRRFIELMDVRVKLLVEDGERVAYASGASQKFLG